MTRRRWWGAAAVALAVLASGCGAATDGSAERGESVSGAVVGTTGDRAVSTVPSTTSSMTQSSGGLSTPTVSDTDSGPATSTAATSPETPSSATETAPPVGACPDVASWTTAEQSTDLAGNAPILEVSADAADCYDSFVITLGPDAHDPGYRVRYVDTVTEDGSGRAVHLAGAASLEVIVDSPAYDPETGRGTLQMPDHDNVVDVSGFDALRQVAYAGSFEGQTTFGIGVAGKLPFAVATGADSDGNVTLTVAVANE